MTQNVEQLIEETKVSYYEYVVKVEGGCTVITDAFKQNNLSTALQGIINLSEGLVWLLEAEEKLEAHSLKIESPIAQVSPLFGKINDAMEASKFEEVILLLEDELKPLFKNANEWKFEEVVS